MCMFANSDLKNELWVEARSSPFSIHLGSNKIYRDLKRCYWWHNMKREIAEFVSTCLVCQKVKAPR